MEDNNIDSGENPYWLCGSDFDDSMLDNFMQYYDTLLSKNRKMGIIYINSSGGNVDILDSILSVIENSTITFHTVVVGKAYSCGLFLATAGDVRWATDRSDFIFHNLSYEDGGNLEDKIENLVDVKNDSKRIIKMFSRRTKFNSEWWLKMAGSRKTKNFKFNGNSALKYGVIDHIGLPEISIVGRSSNMVMCPVGAKLKINLNNKKNINKTNTEKKTKK